MKRDRKSNFVNQLTDRMKEELEIKMCPYFFESRTSSSVQPHRSKIIIPPSRHDIKDHQCKGTIKKSSPVKCDNSQGYGYRVDSCFSLSLFRVIIIDEVFTAVPKLYNIISLVVTLVLKE